MTVRLSVDRTAWLEHVHRVADEFDAHVPVVKGNGYGFGRSVLHPVAAELAARVCVGTVHELDHIANGVTPIVLTPTLTAPAGTAPVITVGAVHHVAALAGWRGRVAIKLASSMLRYGAVPADLDALVAAVRAARLEIDSVSIHLPLAGDDEARAAEITAWLPLLDPAWTVSVSHLANATFTMLREAHPTRRFELRAGTALWHGDKSFLHLTADVIDVRQVRGGTPAGYRLTPVPADGVLVMIGGGSAHGIAPLADGRSPFHFAHRRLVLLEPPHMHTSIGFIGSIGFVGATDGRDAVPAAGDRVDVQRPLIITTVDEIEWRT
ncbi:MAG: alanine racemase [Ilumatobacteraceae bacterium]